MLNNMIDSCILFYITVWYSVLRYGERWLKMAKISLNLPDELEDEIRKFADESNINLTTTCVQLFNKAFHADDEFLKKYNELTEKINLLEEENTVLKEKLEAEQQARLDDFKNLISENLESTRNLIELMKADRVLQINNQKPNKTSFLKKIKLFFSGESGEEEK